MGKNQRSRVKKPICMCAQGHEQNEGPSPSPSARSSEVTEIPISLVFPESFANGLTLPSEISCSSFSDKKLAGRWLNKNLYSSGLTASSFFYRFI